jgi:hypothetical protein
VSAPRVRPARGLPEALPAGERLLWQGAPDWRALSRRAFHTRKVAVYFAILMGWRVLIGLSDGLAIGAALGSALGLLVLALGALGLLNLFAWLSARSTVYTVTTRRLVIHCGIALPMTINLPFRRIQAAGLKTFGGGVGDIVLTLPKGQRVAYLHLWPHVRPWRFNSPEPMLRCIGDSANVAALLVRSLAAETGGQVRLDPIVPDAAALPVTTPPRASAAA